MYFHFRNMRISFISQVRRVQKATTVANDTSLSSTILVLFPEFHHGRPGCNFPYEQTTKFAPVTEPARLTGSYEEALNYGNTIHIFKVSFRNHKSARSTKKNTCEVAINVNKETHVLSDFNFVVIEQIHLQF